MIAPKKQRIRKSSYLNTLKSDARHAEIQVVKVVRVKTLFRDLARYKSLVYAKGMALLAIAEDQEPHSIWINAGVYKVLVSQDAMETRRVTPRTMINPTFIFKGHLNRSRIDHLLFVEKQASVSLHRHLRPSVVVLPPDAIDRVPKVLAEVVKLRRANKTIEMINEANPPIDVSEFAIEEEITRLIQAIDRR